MSTTPSQEFVRRLEQAMADAPMDDEAVSEELAEFGLTRSEVAADGRAMVGRLDARSRVRSHFTPAKLALAAGLAGLVLAGWWLARATPAPPPSIVTPPAHAAEHPATRFDPSEWQSHASGPALSLRSTSALRPTAAAEGRLEISVQPPVPSGASVRVYLRGPEGPTSSLAQWRLAGAGTTDASGVVRLPARPGRYLVVARAPGFATARREVVRPAGEPQTSTSLSLRAGAALSGHVVVRGSGTEVPLAQVALARFATPFSGELDVPEEEVELQTTDARGAFSLAGLEPGTWQLEVRAVGHAPTRRLVQLPRTGALTLELSAASFLEGVVLDASGRRVPRSEVTALCSTLSAVRASETETGPEGTFSLEVEPGRCTVSARSAGASAALQPVNVGAGITVHALELRLEAGASVTGVVRGRDAGMVSDAYVELTPAGGETRVAHANTDGQGHYALSGLPAGAYDLAVFAEGYSPSVRRGVVLAQAAEFDLDIELKATGSVAGVVRDRAGRPVVGAVVQAGTMWGGPFIWGSSSQVRTGADGSYRLSGLNPGHLRVNAGFEPGVWLTREFAEVASTKEGRVDLVLEPSGVLTGVVSEPGGGPLTSDAVVRAIPQSPFVTGADVYAAAVGTDGRFELMLPPGRYSVRAMRADADPFMAPTGPGVEVEPAQRREVSLELSVEGPVALRGRVLQPNGAPAPLASVLLSAPGWRLTASTDAEGRFTARRRPGAPGPSAPPVVDVTARLGGALGRLEQVRSGDEEVLVQLQAAATIHGRVLGVSASSGVSVSAEPLDERAMPWLSTEDRKFPDARFELSEVPAGRVRVTASTSAGQTVQQEVELRPGADFELTLSLASSALVRGMLVDELERPVPGAMVWYDDGQLVPTDAEGRFRFDDVPEGSHRLQVRYDARRAAELEFTVTRGQELDLGRVKVERR